jgi:RHS repeat-associated protein
MGNMLSLTLGTAHTATFSYSGTTPKLTSVTENGSPKSITYDAVGNETQGAVTYSPRNYQSGWRTGNCRLGSCTTATFSYDGRGVRANQLVVFIPGCAGCSTTSSTDSVYTPELNLLYFTNTTTTMPDDFVTSQSSEFVWFGGRPVAEEDVNGLLATTLWLFGDHLGTPSIRTDATPTITSFTEYEPYGPVAANRVGSAPLLRFPGQEGDGYNIFRWYRPNWGRYSQADPIGLQGGINLFAYVSGDPIASADAVGLFRSGQVCCRRRPGNTTWDGADVFVIVYDPAGDANTQMNGGVRVATFGRDPFNANDRCGMVYIGPIWGYVGGVRDPWFRSTETKCTSHFINNPGPNPEQTVRQRARDWAQPGRCYYPYQCSDFVNFVVNGTVPGDVPTTAFCGR